MKIDLKDSFHVLEFGALYEVPQYDVVDEVGLVNANQPMYIDFVNGSKLQGEDAIKHRGTLHEHLLAVMVHDLKYKNNRVPSPETTLVIMKLEEARHWLLHRRIDRAKREVVGTCKP
jgi:hypothetical protein